MSTEPSGTSQSSSSPVSVCSRLASTAPRRWMPTIATRPSGFFSTISCAIRISVRRTSSWSRTTLLIATCSFLASRDRVKGADRIQGNSGGGGSGPITPRPVEHVWEPGCDDLAVEFHPCLLHHAPRRDVVGRGVGDHLIEPEHAERCLNRLPCHLGRQALTPAGGVDGPPDLNLVEARHGGVLEPAPADHLASNAIAQ